MSRIFISYRREDTAGHVLALMQPLRNRFGPERIFKDTDSIKPGEDFVEAIQRELQSCSVMLVVIGREWLTAMDPRLNTRRLDNPNDFLRLEVATALKNEHVLVVPVLVERATMPAAEALPPDLEPLSRRSAVELLDTRWNPDVEGLIAILEPVLRNPGKTKTETEIDETVPDSAEVEFWRNPWFVPTAAAAFAVILAVWWVFAMGGRSREGNQMVLAGGLPPSAASPSPSYPSTPGQVTPGPVTRGPATTPITGASGGAGRGGTAPNVPAPTDAGLATIRRRALGYFESHQLPQSLASAIDGLKIAPGDKILGELLGRLFRDAQSSSNRSKDEATGAGAVSIAPTPFNQGMRKEREAEQQRDAEQPEEAIRSYWAASESFTAAAAQARQVSGAKKEIAGVLERFRVGYIQKNASAILEAYPTAQTDAIFRSLKNCSKLNLTFGDIRIELLANNQAQAEVSSVYGCQPRTGQGERPSKTVFDTFRLERKGRSWVIVRWLIPLG